MRRFSQLAGKSGELSNGFSLVFVPGEDAGALTALMWVGVPPYKFGPGLGIA